MCAPSPAVLLGSGGFRGFALSFLTPSTDDRLRYLTCLSQHVVSVLLSLPVGSWPHASRALCVLTKRARVNATQPDSLLGTNDGSYHLWAA